MRTGQAHVMRVVHAPATTTAIALPVRQVRDGFGLFRTAAFRIPEGGIGRVNKKESSHDDAANHCRPA